MDTRTASGTEAERACHDVLLAMAGRLPDRQLWRLRDWLSCGAHVALRTALPRALLRHRVGVTEDERARLRTAVLGWGGPARLVDAVLHVEAAPAPAAAFAEPGAGPGWDDTDLVLRALAPVTAGVTAVRRAWRSGSAGDAVRVVLVAADGTGDAALTGALQRALRARGEADPCVEVLGPSAVPAPYHREALAVAEVLWRRDAGRVPPPARAGVVASTGELVGHG
ncbi:hypothetical protein [Actinomycetospora cinnamomea]|uniref:Uncharacterized protein n=1 Tax=Actinomycetospora cinnamomea TaxID=663609 RepID=A0A2U1FB42_9PSEU|nr:hypothetical protein [Actinomycetospora cinnamomea]PVZ09405.1 hypothetical protein C8D89_10661 [Actinomycetospora cinnamomea]